jgi:class 3 adenylate cyclase
MTTRTLQLKPRTALQISVGLIVAGIGINLALPTDSMVGLVGLLKLLSVLGLCSLATSLDDRVFHLFVNRHLATRILVHLMTPVVTVGLTLLGIYGAGLPLRSWGDEGTTVVVIACGGVWLTSASLGSLMVLVLNTGVRSISTTFRTRINLTVMAMVALAGALAYSASQLGPEVVGILDRIDATPFGADLGLSSLWLWQTVQVLGPGESDELLALTYFVLLVLMSVPAVLSACSKLSDAVMQAVRPLQAGFEAVAQGQLDVRIPVEGSRDFAKLTHTFNEMVSSLELAKRMERAFGSYVSREILDQIRTQHGRATLEPSLRVATVFFADIRGFTTMSERINPKQLLSVLNRFYESVASVVEAHQGFLVQYIGDAVVVVFNGPIDQPDHATRSVECAIGIQKAVDLLNNEEAFPEIGALEVGIGIATGPMVAGNLGDSNHLLQYTVLGDTVNQAARMTSHVPAGAVWVNQRNADAPGHRRDPMPLAPIKVKGRARRLEPHQVWPALDITELTEITTLQELEARGA